LPTKRPDITSTSTLPLTVADDPSWHMVRCCRCNVQREKLKAEAARALKDIIEFTGRLLSAIDGEQPAGVLTPLDKDLENAIGSKERAFGALAQHCNDHGCR